MVSIIETMRFKYATVATIFIAIFAIGSTGDGQGIKGIPSSNLNPIVRQGVSIP